MQAQTSVKRQAVECYGICMINDDKHGANLKIKIAA